MSTRILSLIFGGILLLAAPFGWSCRQSTPKPKTYSAPPKMTINPDKQYTATIETENGNLILNLFAKDVPVTVNNFVFLARESFYDGITFHRVIPGFMAQGGDPTGTGMGGPGYSFRDEFTTHTHVAGAMSMANAGPDTTAPSSLLRILRSMGSMASTQSLDS